MEAMSILSAETSGDGEVSPNFSISVRGSVTRMWGKHIKHYYYNELEDTPSKFTKEADSNQRQEKEWSVGM